MDIADNWGYDYYYRGLIGYYFEKKGVINRINSHANRNANPEFLQLCKDVKEIKDRLK